jgi:hypothetical protein
MVGYVERIDRNSKNRKSVMGSYFPTKEEMDAQDFCIRNNIRISYVPATPGAAPKEWHISIIIGPYKKGEKPHLSPEVYPAVKCKEQMYKTCMYYYEKYRK